MGLCKLYFEFYFEFTKAHFGQYTVIRKHKQLRNFVRPDEAGAFLHDPQERLATATSPLRVALRTGFEGTEGLPEVLLKVLEPSIPPKASVLFSESSWSSAVILTYL